MKIQHIVLLMAVLALEGCGTSLSKSSESGRRQADSTAGRRPLSLLFDRGGSAAFQRQHSHEQHDVLDFHLPHLPRFAECRGCSLAARYATT